MYNVFTMKRADWITNSLNPTRQDMSLSDMTVFKSVKNCIIHHEKNLDKINAIEVNPEIFRQLVRATKSIDVMHVLDIHNSPKFFGIPVQLNHLLSKDEILCRTDRGTTLHGVSFK